ncbi:MAG: hypothetical protein IT367_18085 [Candidatus Hydrogenedentes bacterium]|nr:hypothetical protein [Candidatus Hydrogenedentota bacterium]
MQLKLGAYAITVHETSPHATSLMEQDGDGHIHIFVKETSSHAEQYRDVWTALLDLSEQLGATRGWTDNPLAMKIWHATSITDLLRKNPDLRSPDAFNRALKNSDAKR